MTLDSIQESDLENDSEDDTDIGCNDKDIDLIICSDKDTETWDFLATSCPTVMDTNTASTDGNKTQRSNLYFNPDHF